MRLAHQAGQEDASLKESLASAGEKFEGLRDEVDRDLRSAWHEWDAGDDSARHSVQKKMVNLLDRRRYLNNLVRDVTETLGA